MSRLLLRLFEAVERNSSFRCCGFIPLPLLNGLDPDRSLRLIVPEYVYGCTQRCTAIILGAGSINAGAGVVIVFSCPSTFGALCFFLQIRPLSSAVCAFLFCARPIYKAAKNARRSALNELKQQQLKPTRPVVVLFIPRSVWTKSAQTTKVFHVKLWRRRRMWTEAFGSHFWAGSRRFEQWPVLHFLPQLMITLESVQSIQVASINNYI